MAKNLRQVWNKTTYNPRGNHDLWDADSFVRKDNLSSNSTYLIEEVYLHGISTHLFDRHQGIYTYQKQPNSNKVENLNSTEKDSVVKGRLDLLPSKWSPSLKSSGWLD